MKRRAENDAGDARRSIVKERRRESDARDWPASCHLVLTRYVPTPSAAQRTQSRNLITAVNNALTAPDTELAQTRHMFLHETRRGITDCKKSLLPTVIIGHIQARKLTVPSFLPILACFESSFPKTLVYPLVVVSSHSSICTRHSMLPAMVY
jgi:hypothetical protein